MSFVKTSVWLTLFIYSSMVCVAEAANERAIFDLSLGDFSEELVEAKENGKKGILLFFEMDECPFCHRMKTTVLNQPEVMAYFKKHFSIYAIDIEGDVVISDFSGQSMTMKEFALTHNRVRATPVFAFFDLTGKRIVRYTGPTSGVEEFMWLGEYVVNGHYEKLRFTKYKRQKRKEKKNNNKG